MRINEEEMELLTKKMEHLKEISNENLEKNADKLHEAQAKLCDIFISNFGLVDKTQEELESIDVEYFQTILSEDASSLKKIFELFLTAKAIKKRLDAITLVDSEINRQIQPKFCRVISDYGVGTGYIHNAPDGQILSSFHLMSKIRPVLVTESPDLQEKNIITILYASEYIDEEFRLTKKALAITTKKEIFNKIRTINVDYQVSKNVRIRPKDIIDILDNKESVKWMANQLQDAKNKHHRFFFSVTNDEQTKLAFALVEAGYLDGHWGLTQKARDLNDFENIDIIPNTEKFHLLLSKSEQMKELMKRSVENIISNKEAILDKIFNFFSEGKNRKDVVLLTDTVDIQLGHHLLVAKVILPECSEENRKRILRNFAYFDAVPLQITHHKNGRPFTDFRILSGKAIAVLPEDEQPSIGEKIYFGGFPLTQQQYSFSIGIISAISHDESRRSYVLEAPIAPGNSGSPVFIQKSGQVFWLGIINSEVARVSEDVLTARDKLENIPNVMEIGGLGLIESISHIANALLDNLSTGKGKAFEIPETNHLLNPNLFDSLQEIDPFLDFLVPGKKLKPKKQSKGKDPDLEESSCLYEKFICGDEVYCLNPDNHTKHTSLSKKVSFEIAKDPRYLKEKWGMKVATFNLEFSAKYKETVKEVIRRIALAKEETGQPELRYVRYDCMVGWDRGASKQGEETDIIELYYEQEIGSHIRPKAESSLSRKDIIVPIRPSTNETSLISVVGKNTGSPLHQNQSLNTAMTESSAIQELISAATVQSVDSSQGTAITIISFPDYSLAAQLQSALFNVADRLGFTDVSHLVEISKVDSPSKQYRLILTTEQYNSLIGNNTLQAMS